MKPEHRHADHHCAAAASAPRSLFRGQRWALVRSNSPLAVMITLVSAVLLHFETQQVLGRLPRSAPEDQGSGKRCQRGEECTLPNQRPRRQGRSYTPMVVTHAPLVVAGWAW
jgi:hypothetical protein